jgi:hypothetical protein
MSNTHDQHVLDDLIAAILATEGAPQEALDVLEAQARLEGDAAPGAAGLSVVEAAREALEGLFGQKPPAPIGLDAGGAVQRLAALMARMEGALRDERLSGPARDAVLRAYDPVKQARDQALQEQAGGAPEAD